MQLSIRSGLRTCSVVLCLFLISSCGGGGGDSSGKTSGGRNFETGTSFNNVVTSITTALDGSGDVYVGGAFTQYDGKTANRMARLNRNGSLDPGFDVSTGFSSSVHDIEAIDDGSGDLYVGGDFTQFRGNVRNRIVRVTPSGTEAAIDFGSGFDLPVFSLALNDGKGDLYAGGRFDLFRGLTRHFVARVNPDGSADTGFVTGSGFLSSVGLPRVHAVAVTRDGLGKVYAGGLFETYRGNARSGIVRILPDGANDSTFSPGTGFATGAGSRPIISAIAIATDGSNRVYVGGTFLTFNGISSNRIARLNPNGTYDASFNVGTGFVGGSVDAIAVANDGSGDVYVGGNVSIYDGTPVGRIARLNSDGSLDTGFVTGTGFDNPVFAIAPATDGSGDVYVGGSFISGYNGNPASYIVRLNADGSLD